MVTRRTILPRLPKVLANEVLAALDAVRDLGPERTMELLTRYRRNRALSIATWRVNNIGAHVDGLEKIPAEHVLWIRHLDKAFQNLHHFRNGGAGDYVAADVEKAINSHRAKLPRSGNNSLDGIAKFLKIKKYDSCDNKKALVEEAKTRFDCSESTVRRAIRAGSLGRKRKSAVT